MCGCVGKLEVSRFRGSRFRSFEVQGSASVILTCSMVTCVLVEREGGREEGGGQTKKVEGSGVPVEQSGCVSCEYCEVTEIYLGVFG